MAVRVALIAAVARNGVIGDSGDMPWRMSSDQKLFRRLTMGKPVIMGRKTLASIGGPLDGRDNVVVTRNRDFEADGVTATHDLDEAIAVASERAMASDADEVMIIGGGEIYAQAIGGADRLYISALDVEADGDTRFPKIDPAVWREAERTPHPAGPRDDASFDAIVYERRVAKPGG